MRGINSGTGSRAPTLRPRPDQPPGPPRSGFVLCPSIGILAPERIGSHQLSMQSAKDTVRHLSTQSPTRQSLFSPRGSIADGASLGNPSHVIRIQAVVSALYRARAVLV